MNYLPSSISKSNGSRRRGRPEVGDGRLRCLQILATIPVVVGAFTPGLAAAQRPASQQIIEAVSPLSRRFRSEATVMGYYSGARLTVLKQGTNQFICLADDPTDRRFQVSCYHEDLDPFMARGRELRALGKRGTELQRIRNAEIEAGLLRMPERASVISYYGVGELDPATGLPDSVTTLQVLYLPYATSDETGFPARPSRSPSPYLMDAGTARAHLMIPGERRAYRPRDPVRRR